MALALTPAVRAWAGPEAEVPIGGGGGGGGGGVDSVSGVGEAAWYVRHFEILSRRTVNVRKPF